MIKTVCVLAVCLLTAQYTDDWFEKNQNNNNPVIATHKVMLATCDHYFLNDER